MTMTHEWTYKLVDCDLSILELLVYVEPQEEMIEGNWVWEMMFIAALLQMIWAITSQSLILVVTSLQLSWPPLVTVPAH